MQINIYMETQGNTKNNGKSMNKKIGSRTISSRIEIHFNSFYRRWTTVGQYRPQISV